MTRPGQVPSHPDDDVRSLFRWRRQISMAKIVEEGGGEGGEGEADHLGVSCNLITRRQWAGGIIFRLAQ